MVGTRSKLIKFVPTPEGYSEQGARGVLLCDCGREFETSLRHVRLKNSGCNECSVRRMGAKNKTHGEPHRSKEYKVWCAIKDRCYNVNCREFKFYGQRGIKMFEGWLTNFPAFLEHIGRSPSLLHSLERVRNNEGYIPNNLKWATKKEQARNRRSSFMVIYQDKSINIQDLADNLGMCGKLLYDRVAMQKLSLEVAINKPVRQKKKE